MTITDMIPPRLTRLDMQGFKSFANRTQFVFESGITAVIGPNGSGKSNISDGVRWVLGETSHNLLRSRKTEDVIFAGGHGKAPAGMAEVSVTFDNSSGWLPIEFNEVAVTRRAFRSGENQYLINGKKIRLKDVQHLTASLGQSYTVVGQGLVDTALSQRAEERRGLFEHAADLTGLQLKVSEAERNLSEAEANAERINDLLTSVEPRLRILERAAKQAREWQGVHDRVRWLAQGFYKHHLSEAAAAFSRAEASASGSLRNADAAAEHVEWLTAELKLARLDVESSQAAFAKHEATLGTVLDQLRRIGHERDLAAERLAALKRRQDDMRDTQEGLDGQSATVERDLAIVESELQEAERAFEESRQSHAELQRQVTRARDARSARDRQLAQLAPAVQSIERQLNDLHRHLALLEQRRESGSAEQERAATANSERSAKIERLAAEIEGLGDVDRTSDDELNELDAAITELLERATDAGRQEQEAAAKLAVIDQLLSEARVRLEALQRIHDSGAGLFAGVRAVLDAAKQGDLTGIRGTVAELVTVPTRFETAIEVAMGSHLQDVVTDRWEDAGRAIELLKRTKSGRATFQPLDSISEVRLHSLDDTVASRNGVHGVAVTLVHAADGVDRVVAGLLGRTLVVEDLDTARAMLPRLAGGWSAVTVAGEIVRSSGSVTGGSAVRESGVLGRERELRELPGQIAKFTQDRVDAAAALAECAGVPRRLAEERRELDATKAALTATRRERVSQRSRLSAWLGELKREDLSAQERTANLWAAAQASDDEWDALRRESEKREQELDQARGAHQQLIERGGCDAGHLNELEAQLAKESQRFAGLEERVRSETRRKTGLLAQQRALTEERAMRNDRFSAISGEIDGVVHHVERLGQESSALAIERDRIKEAVKPLQSDVDKAASGIARLEQQLDEARQRLLDAERVKGTAQLGVERARGDLATLRQRVLDDLEMENPDDLLTMDVELDGEIDEVEREISRLKERLRRVGYIGEEAVEEFERESERHHFLRSQLDDVEGASMALRTLLDDLRTTMRQRFDETFEQVAEAFAASFTTLFGGGTARLVMVANENGAGAGVDIVAQPPGKRLQSLALLSGGERSLTAAALLFAILKVNPTPFVLLDEVDAALDESNVVRFREQLQQLARETQAVIITHNRGTIEVADSLYGVSMRDDGVSTVLSLRMSEAERVG